MHVLRCFTECYLGNSIYRPEIETHNTINLLSNEDSLVKKSPPTIIYVAKFDRKNNNNNNN